MKVEAREHPAYDFVPIEVIITLENQIDVDRICDLFRNNPKAWSKGLKEIADVIEEVAMGVK